MPLELGLFLGAKKFGTRHQRKKACIIFDSEQYRFQRFISDIAGQDIHHHLCKADVLIRELAAWLRSQPGGRHVGGGAKLFEEFERFRLDLPRICASKEMEVSELRFSDLNEIVTQYALVLDNR